MAAFTTPKLIPLIILIVFSNIIPLMKSQEFSRRLSRTHMNLKQQKLTHLHFYFHDTNYGPNPTAFRIANASITNNTPTFFGALNMMDDPLTVTHELTSKIVGRGQGIYGLADLKSIGLFMVFNFYFTEGKFNGSTLSIMGRNPIFEAVREMPVVGGSGVFRFANGYAETRTHTFNLTTGNAVVEYNVYVFHY